MKILICSKSNEFAKVLSKRLKNESHELYQITGESIQSNENDARVFQKYDFDYANENVSKIMKNVSADVLIIAGYIDFYSYKNVLQHKSVDYITGMSNIILSAKMAGIKRIIYCSTFKIFENIEELFISKTSKPSTISFDNGALAQIDTFISSCRDEGKTDIDIIRFPEVYGNYSKNSHYEDFCSKMLMRDIKNKDIRIPANANHMAIGIKDSVQVILDVLKSDEKNYVYHIDAEIFSENSIAKEIISQNKNNSNIIITDKEAEFKPAFPLKIVNADNHKLKYSARYTIIDEIPSLYKKAKYQKMNEDAEKDHSAIKRITRTLLETSLLFVLVTLLQFGFDSFSLGINIDFYLIFVIVIGAIYGVSYSMFSTVLSIFGKLFFSLSTILTMMPVLDFQLFMETLQLSFAAIIVGLMRDNFTRKEAEFKDKHEYNSKQVTDISRINESNAYVKNVYGKRITAYRNNLARLFNMTSQLTFLDASKVIFQTAKVVSEFLETEHVAIFVSSKRSSFFRLAASTSDKGKSIGKSFVLDKESYFYQSLLHHDVYMNRDFSVDKPTYISAVYSEDNTIDAVIMIWVTELEQISLYQSSLISVLSRLVEKTMSSALEFESLQFENAFLEDTRVMNIDSFKEKLITYQNGAEMNLLSYIVMKIEAPEQSVDKELFSKVERLVRDTDYIGSDMTNLYVLLSSSDESDSRFVVNRFAQNNMIAKTITNEEIMGKEDIE